MVIFLLAKLNFRFLQAIDFDTFEAEDGEAATSSMVDDVFFIIQKSLR